MSAKRSVDQRALVGMSANPLRNRCAPMMRPVLFDCGRTDIHTHTQLQLQCNSRWLRQRWRVCVSERHPDRKTNLRVPGAICVRVLVLFVTFICVRALPLSPSPSSLFYRLAPGMAISSAAHSRVDRAQARVPLPRLHARVARVRAHRQ